MSLVDKMLKLSCAGLFALNLAACTKPVTLATTGSTYTQDSITIPTTDTMYTMYERYEKDCPEDLWHESKNCHSSIGAGPCVQILKLNHTILIDGIIDGTCNDQVDAI